MSREPHNPTAAIDDMSKILSYSDNTTGSGWIAKEPYSGDDIARITDPNGDAVERPRTSIPSPFARVDLVATAFATLASHSLRGAAMHHRLVSDALDIAQLLFSYSGFSDRVRIVRWHPARHLQQMRQGSPAHALLADTLELYMTSDSKAYNFDMDDAWYVLMYRNTVIGSTSPATYTMGAPIEGEVGDLMIEEGTPLFSRRVRHLWERDEDFVVYLVHWFNANAQARLRLKCVYDYILANLEIIKFQKPALYSRVTARVENPHALDAGRGAELKASLENLYAAFDTALQPRVLGIPLMMRRHADTLSGPSHSDFMIAPAKKQMDGAALPLVLKQGFVSPDGEPYTYINKPWRESTPVEPVKAPLDERVLPDTAITYPWITEADLLDDTLIELATPMDRTHFFSPLAGGPEPEHGYLLPVKPLFFHYFPASFLTCEVSPGRKVAEMRPTADGDVVVLLRIPVKKGYVEFAKTYRHLVSQAGEGAISGDVRLSAAVFPFVRTGSADMYNIRLFEMLPHAGAGLRFFADDSPGALPVPAPTVRTRTRAMRTQYYEVDHSWDYARVDIVSTHTQESHSGVLLPLWPDYNPGVQRHVFAVDFGTTNSHVEYSVDDAPARPLAFSPSMAATLVATTDEPGSLAQADTMLDVEFVPRSIEGAFGFPLRTALASNNTSQAAPRSLANINIPFLYERKAFNGYRIDTMLKWSNDTELSEQFLREIMILIRARVLLDGASPANTRIVYFYPVSMSRSLQNRYMTLWENLYMRYLNPERPDVVAYPESVAPAFHYADSTTAGTDYAGIDIGGGSTDVVIYRSDEERLNSQAAVIASFRFAGDSIFGDAFAGADASNNPMLSHYIDYFSSRLKANPQYSYLDVILGDIAATNRSRDISAFLFSIENAPGLRDMPALDRAPYSFNALLRDDTRLSLVFVYFYTALIYYVARLMKQAGVGLPRRLFFSGTGSKILNILGRHDVVQGYTRHVIEQVYGTAYGPATPFSLKHEQEFSKQVTCKGGIALEREIRAGHINPELFSPRYIMGCKSSYTMTDNAPYTNASLRTMGSRREVVQAVGEFNRMFSGLLSDEWRDEFGISPRAMRLFAGIADRDLDAYMTTAVNALVARDASPDEQVEDIPFFYPIVSVIRYTLIPALCSNTD